MLTTRISIVVIIMLELFLLVAAYHRAPHASVGSSHGFPAADRRRASAVVVGDHKDMEKLILWRRKMAAKPPHKSPPGPHNLRHQRRVLGASLEREDDRPPSPVTKNSVLSGAGDDVMTKMKEAIIICRGGKHERDKYGVVASRCRRWRRLIAAGPSDSPPSPGYHRL